VLSTPSPEKIQDDIKNWTTEKTKLIVRPHDNPKTHFSIWVSPPTPRIIIPTTVKTKVSTVKTKSIGPR
jgi:hypothetical protein